MLVMKFGGTSVGSSEAIQRVAQIIRSRLEEKPVVVVSALAKTTDELVSLTQLSIQGSLQQAMDLIDWVEEKHSRVFTELDLESGILGNVLTETKGRLEEISQALSQLGTLDPILFDECLSFGEYLSANIVAAYLNREGIPSEWCDARKILVTDTRFGKARPRKEESKLRSQQFLLPIVGRGRVPVIQGFVGADETGRTTTLGRGGSDYTATLLGAMIEAKRVEIWTDVDGVLSADPALVPEALRIRRLTFEEAAELAYFGAKVLHPSSIRPAVDQGVSVFVLNSSRPEGGGTEIRRSDPRPTGEAMVKSIAYKEGVTVLNIKSTRMLMAYGFLSSIFEVFNRFETSVDLVSTSEVSVSVTIDEVEHLTEIVQALQEFAEVEIRHDNAVVCCVGENIGGVPGMPARVFSALDGIEIVSISQGASEINISFVVNEKNLPEVVKRLHRKFFSGDLNEKIFESRKERQT